MANKTIEVQLPDGKTAEFDAPDTATPDQIKQVVAHLSALHGHAPTPPPTAQQQSVQGNWEGIQPQPLVVPNNAPEQGLAGLGDLMSGKGLDEAAAVTQQTNPQPQSTAGAIGQGIGQMVSPSNIATAALIPDLGAARQAAKAGELGQVGRVISGPARQEAGTAIGAAEDAAGVHRDIVPTLKDAASNLGLKNPSAKEYLNALMERLKSGEEMSAQALSQHHKMISDLLSKEPQGLSKVLGTPSKLGAPAAAQAVKADAMLVDQLNAQAPGRAEAAANYAAAKTREKIYKGVVGAGVAAAGRNVILDAFNRISGRH